MSKTMSKTFKAILIFSIAANALWLLAAASGYFSFRKPSGANTSARAPTSTLSPATAKEIAAMLSTNDLAALRDQLRALGLPEDLTRSILEERIASGATAIVKKAAEKARQHPYWRWEGFVSYTNLNMEQARELADFGKEQQKQLKQLFGDAPESIYLRLNYPFLSADKAARLAEVQSDYGDLQMRVIQEMSGFRMPDDEAKARLLAEEQQRDIQALLTPEEQAENNLRNSPTAQTVQFRLSGLDATEDEYKTLYALQSAFDEKYPDSEGDMRLALRISGIYTLTGADARAQAQKELDAQIKSALGDERYAQYQRAQRNDYRTLQAAAQRFNLAPETVAQTYQVRETAASEAARISGDASLDANQKTQAYAALADQATDQIRASLGDEIGDAYINNALSWLKQLPQGGTVRVSEDGGNVYVSPPPRAPAK